MSPDICNIKRIDGFEDILMAEHGELVTRQESCGKSVGVLLALTFGEADLVIVGIACHQIDEFGVSDLVQLIVDDVL